MLFPRLEETKYYSADLLFDSPVTPTFYFVFVNSKALGVAAIRGRRVQNPLYMCVRDG